MTSATFEEFGSLPARKKKEIIKRAVVFAKKEQVKVMRKAKKMRREGK